MDFTHLRYDMQEAPSAHPQIAMARLGITYQLSTPQSMGGQWWFWNCANVPEALPPYLSTFDLDPMACVGFGLSLDDAIALSTPTESAPAEYERRTVEFGELEGFNGEWTLNGKHWVARFESAAKAEELRATCGKRVPFTATTLAEDFAIRNSVMYELPENSCKFHIFSLESNQ